MLIFQIVGEREAASFNNGSVVLLIANHIIAASGECGHHTQVHTKAGGINHGIFLTHVGSQSAFEVFVNVERTIEERRACTACTVFFNRLNGGFVNALIVHQSGVAVGTEHQHLFTFHVYFGVLFTLNFAEIRINTQSLCFLRLLILR